MNSLEPSQIRNLLISINKLNTKKEKIQYLYTHNDTYLSISSIKELADCSDSEISTYVKENQLIRSWNAVKDHRKEILLEALYNQGVTPERQASIIKEGTEALNIIAMKKNNKIEQVNLGPDHQARIKYLRLIAEIEGTVQHQAAPGVTVNIGISFDRVAKMSEEELDKEIKGLQSSAQDAESGPLKSDNINTNPQDQPVS
jgi:hypothetical protein